MGMLRILIADDHEVARRGIRALLESHPGWEVCGEVADGREAVACAGRLKPDLVLLDIGIPSLNRLDATRQILAAAPETRVLILTMHDAGPLLVKMRDVGVQGYLLKSDAPKGLPLAINSLLRDQPFFGVSGSEQFRPEKT